MTPINIYEIRVQAEDSYLSDEADIQDFVNHVREFFGDESRITVEHVDSDFN